MAIPSAALDAGPAMGARDPGRERAVGWALLALALLVGLVATVDAWRLVGRVSPGFAVMANLQVGVGGAGRASFEPLDVVGTVSGRPVRSVEEIRAEAARHPPGTVLRYTVREPAARAGVVVELPTHLVTRRDFGEFLLDATLPGLLILAIGAVVVTLRPGAADTRLFLAFCLTSAVTTFGYFDLMAVHRFTRLTLAVWAFSPAVFTHLALAFPERREFLRHNRWVVSVPYLVSAGLAGWLQWTFRGHLAPSGEVVAGYWGLAMVALVASLLRTAVAGSSPLVRQRARVLLVAFAVGYLLPVTSTAAEMVFRVTVPALRQIWKLSLLFPVAIAYAIVRYQLFDVRAVLRLGTIYSAVTVVLALGYTGLLTALNLSLSHLEMHMSPLASAVVVSLAVVAFVNPVYRRTRRLLDRLFFRSRYDAQRAAEALADELTAELDLQRIASLLGRTLGAVLHPAHVTLLIAEDGRGLRAAEGSARRLALPGASPLAARLAADRAPLTVDRLAADPALAETRQACLGDMAALGADLVAPILFRGRLTAVLAVGPRRAQAPYTSDDVRFVRQVASQSAVAIENARAYHALEAALRRVQLLESIRTNLAKFVPRAVRDLIDEAPEAPALGKREADVSVLFVDIAGYTGLSERLDAAGVNTLVERYFGAFLDEILARGGDVNETAGDGLMVIFRDEDPRRHAHAAVGAALAILGRARAINAELAGLSEPIRLHVGVNSGVAAVGATRLEAAAGARWTYTASGPVTNVAARLAGLSADDVVLGDETRRRLGDDIPAEDLGEHALRNVAGPVRIHRLRPAAAAAPAATGSP